MKYLLKRLQIKEINRKKRREGGPERKKRIEVIINKMTIISRVSSGTRLKTI